MTKGVPVVLESVSRRFGRVQALDGVSFDLQPGAILGLLGPNGAGKTTTMRLITGYLRPDHGSVHVGDLDVTRDGVAARRLVGYLPEQAPVPRELTVRGFLRWCANLRGVSRRDRTDAVERAVHQAGLVPMASQVIGTLSKGYRQRVGLAQALVHDPPVLVLDEPTAGLDPRQVTETRNLIARLGHQRTVLFSSHLLAEVSALCRRVAILEAGKLLAVRDVTELSRAATAEGGVRLEIKVTGDPNAAAAVLRQVAGVTRAEARGNRIVARVTDAGVTARVSTALISAGFALVDLRSTAESLEDAYLRIVRG